MINDPALVNDWHVVAYAADVTVGKPYPFTLLGEDMVLWRSGSHLMAWQDLCVHRGTRLSLGKVNGDTLICPYHGWVYNTEGSCVRIPAHPNQSPPTRARVQSYHVQERYGWVWVSPGNPAHDIPRFPQWEDDSFRKIHAGPYVYNANAPRAVENFLDVTHFPFVHEGYLGDPMHAEINDYEAVIDERGITSEDIRVWQPNPDGTGVGKDISYTYRVFRPLTVYFEKTSEGPSFAIYFVVTPTTLGKCSGWMCMAMNYAFDKPAEELRLFQDVVTAQDLPIVESQRPELLPLDLQSELHLRSDRTAIAYRKWLSELGVTFGTS